LFCRFLHPPVVSAAAEPALTCSPALPALDDDSARDFLSGDRIFFFSILKNMEPDFYERGKIYKYSSFFLHIFIFKMYIERSSLRKERISD